MLLMNMPLPRFVLLLNESGSELLIFYFTMKATVLVLKDIVVSDNDDQ